MNKGSKKRKDLHLTIIGDNIVGGGPKIEKQSTDRITFLGWVPHEKLASYYTACDAVVMPSRWEAFGLVAIEAMKYGKPVIASDRGALPEIIQDDSDGYIFSDEAGLQYVLSVITREDAGRKGINAGNKFRNHFVEKTMIRRTLFIYQKENFRLDEI